MDLIVLVLLAGLALIVGYLVVKRIVFVARVNELPGPQTTVIIGNLPTMSKHNFDLLAVCRTLCTDFKSYGIFRIWVGPFAYVAVNTAEFVETVLSSTAHIDKSSDYSVLHPWLRFGLLTSTGAKWHTRRRLITPTFHFKILEEFVPVFNRNTRVLVRSLARETERGHPFDVGHYVHLCALDTICESAMGTTVLAQENAESDYVHAVKVACSNCIQRLVKPWLYPNILFYASPSGWSFSKAVKVLHGLTKSVIQTRKRELQSSDQTAGLEASEDGVKKRAAFLDQLLLANQKGAGLSDMDIQEEVDTFMFEGHDTTGTAISFCLYELSANPEIQELAFQEVSSIVGTWGRDITSQDLSEMKYLARVVKETLRLYPSVPVFNRALKTDLQFNGGPKGPYLAPAGSILIISTFMLHRAESLWPDPERFDPDRFLPENSVGRHPFSYVPFSAGPRNCVGQKYAMMEMKLILAHLLLEYRFLEAYPGYKPEVVGELILKTKGNSGVLVRLQKRVDE